MKTTAIVLALALTGIAGLAIANPANDPESAFVLDLTPANGSSYHVHCKNHQPLSNCKDPTIWENTNRLRGLQTGATPTTTGLVDPDSMLTP
jgi:hypothetical protein